MLGAGLVFARPVLVLEASISISLAMWLLLMHQPVLMGASNKSEFCRTVSPGGRDWIYDWSQTYSGDRPLGVESPSHSIYVETAIAESIRLDILEVPAKALALEKKIAIENLTSLEKARIANKPKLKP